MSPVTEASGCMRFMPGSHRGELLPHVDTFEDKNALTRGQEAVVAIDDAETISVLLRPD